MNFTPISPPHSPLRAATPLRVCTWNLEDFSADNADKLAGIAATIGDAMRGPHIVAVQEMRGPVGSNETPNPTNPNAEALIAAIKARSGFDYAYCEVSPPPTEHGGPPGGHIRCGFFYRTDRVALTEPCTTATDQEKHRGFLTNGQGPHLVHNNPQALQSDSGAFKNFRKPLLGQFTDRASGEQYFILNVHLKSNPGLYPRTDGLASPQSVQLARRWRHAQAYAIRDFSRRLWAAHTPAAQTVPSHVILCGDFNSALDGETPDTKQASWGKNGTPPRWNPTTLDIVGKSGLHCISEDLPPGSSHSVGEFSSNIDHVFVSWPLLERSRVGRLIVNHGDRDTRLSDHNPTLMHIAPMRQRTAPSLGRGAA